jgi:hypothetical protein
MKIRESFCKTLALQRAKFPPFSPISEGGNYTLKPQAKFSKISIDINQSLSIDIQNNMFISHEINHKRKIHN